LEADYFNLPDVMEGDPEPESEPQEPECDHSLEVEPDRKVIFLSAKPKQPPVAEELEPKKSAEPETKSAEPAVEKVRVPDRDDVQGTDNEDPVRSAEPKVIVNSEPCLGSEPNESLIVNAEPELKVDPAEVKFLKRRTIDDDW
jgi:hypothetical protein